MLFALLQKLLHLLRRVKVESDGSTVLIVVNGYNLHASGRKNSNCWQIEKLEELLSANAIYGKYILQPFSSKPHFETFVPVYRIEGYLPTSAYLKIIGAYINPRNRLVHKQDIFNFIVSEIWLAFLSRNKVKILFAVFAGEMLIVSCNELKIDLIEVQHGGLAENYFSNSLVVQKNRIPSKHVVWSAREKFFLESKGYKSFAIGHPYNQRNKMETIFYKDFDILLTLTYDHNQPADIEALFGLDMLRVTRTILKTKYSVAIRLHPMSIRRITIGEFTKTFQHYKYYLKDLLGDSKFTLVNPLKEDLASTISSSRLLITESGSSLLDAALSGVPSLLIDSTTPQILQINELLNRGYVYRANPEILLKQIAQLVDLKITPYAMSGISTDISELIDVLKVIRAT